MSELDTGREKINAIDRQMAALFKERMGAVEAIALYKKERGLKVFDEQREAFLLERNAGYVEDPVLRSYYVSFLKSVMDISKQYQHRLLDGIRVACSGVEGAYAHIAARKIFPDGQFCFYKGFEAAYRSVEAGECDCCVLPVENSYTGEVNQVTDLLFSGSLYVSGVYRQEIRHHLLGCPGARMEDIKTVLSHPQALEQCEGYIREHGFETKGQISTATSAKAVAEGGDPTLAAIASRETAQLYGLTVLDHDINESQVNTTRFAVFTRAEPKADRPDSRFIMVFTVRHEAGALAKAIRIIGKYGFNMRSLRSRPIKEKPWQYYFYVEAEGDVHGENGRQMLEELEKRCKNVKIAGSYFHEDTL